MFLDPTTALFETGLRVAAEKERILAANLANLDTPGYRPERLPFKAALAEALRDGGTVPPPTLGSGIQRNDGNGVDLDREMADLTKNGLRYSFIAGELRDRYHRYQAVIAGGDNA